MSSVVTASPSADLWTRRALGAATVAGIGVSLLSMTSHVVGGRSLALLLFGVSLMLLCARLSHVPPRKRSEPETKGPAPALVIGAWLVQLALVVAVTTMDAVLLLPVVLIAAQAHFWLYSDRDFPAAGVLALTAAQALVAFLFLPNAFTMLLLPVVLAVAVTGGALVHGRASRRHLARALRGIDLPAASRRGLGQRTRFAVVLSFVALLFALFLQSTLRNVSEAFMAAIEPAPTEELASAEPREESRGAGNSNGLPIGGEDDGSASFSSKVDYDQPFYGTGDQLIARVKPISGVIPPRGLGPVYLRCTVLDEFTSKGVQMSRRPLAPFVTDTMDGAVDGWTGLVKKPFPNGGRVWEIEQSALRLAGYGKGSIVPTVDPAHSVAQSPIRWDPDQALVHAGPVTGWFTLQQRSDLPPLAGLTLQRRRAKHASKMYVQLPKASADLARITSDAKQITRNANTDYERVKAVMDHFARGFTYSTETPTKGGVGGLVKFLDEKDGYCVQYASSSVVMLRSLGIASRVVQGFLATEWISVDSLYDVYPPDLHAWIEVHFAGVGWVRFDPTPSNERLAAVRPPEAGLGGWADELSDLLEQWATEGEFMSLDDLAALLARGPGALVRSVGRGALLIAAIIFIALGVFLVMPSRRRKKGKRRGPEGDTARRAREHYERILHALARLGYRKRAAQTPREFAVALIATRDDVLRPLGDLTEKVYATRFGDQELTAADEVAIDAFIQALREAEKVRG